jgi:uncharacterized membrane protein
MSQPKLPLSRFVHARPHLSLAFVLGAALAPLLPDHWDWVTRLLVCWDSGVWLYLVTMGYMMWRADHEDVQRVAARQDERSGVILATLSVAALASLAAIVSQLSALKDMGLEQRAGHYVLVVATLAGSWLLLGTLFCVHYGHAYYNDDGGQPPLAFPDQGVQPDYWDFLYFSFTIAVAAQTSDVAVRSREVRRAVLAQSVLSFLFNLAVLGLSINIAASLVNN